MKDNYWQATSLGGVENEGTNCLTDNVQLWKIPSLVDALACRVTHLAEARKGWVRCWAARWVRA